MDSHGFHHHKKSAEILSVTKHTLRKVRMRLYRAILTEKECVVQIGAAINSAEIPRFYAYQFFLYLFISYCVRCNLFSLKKFTVTNGKKSVSPAKWATPPYESVSVELHKLVFTLAALHKQVFLAWNWKFTVKLVLTKYYERSDEVYEVGLQEVREVQIYPELSKVMIGYSFFMKKILFDGHWPLMDHYLYFSFQF